MNFPQLVGSFHPDVPLDVLGEWQDMASIIARSCNVRAALVVRADPAAMEVVATSDGECPYRPRERLPREGLLYCEAVVAEQTPLEVPDADADPRWRGNPEAALGLVSYYGMPVNWPDGTPFGTLCILDDAPRRTTACERQLITRFRRILERYLQLLARNAELDYVASHDPLTGLLNRRIFEQLCIQQIALHERGLAAPALVSVDLDRFKTINDSFGHAVGDRVLERVAQLLTANLRATDACARIGGEEFMILLPVTDAEGARAFAERLREHAASSELVAPWGETPVTLSCGVAVRDPHEPLLAWQKRADDALYAAKGAGRDRVELAPSAGAGPALAEHLPWCGAAPASSAAAERRGDTRPDRGDTCSR